MWAPMTRTLAAGAVVLGLAACGGSEPVASDQPVSSDAVAAVDTSEPLEAVLVPTAAGEQLDFNSLRGQDVLLWFWAPW